MNKRKLFISFLGANSYFPVKYSWNGQPDTVKRHYLAISIFDLILKNNWYYSKDEVIVFTTADAFKNNYNERIETTRNEDCSFKNTHKPDGLEKQIKALFPEINITHCDIANGNNEQEILAIFQKIFEKIKPNTELYLDITFGFRPIPMIAMALIPYARVLHSKVTIAGIYYGNFEAGKALQAENNGEIIAPIIDLLAFVKLQDWTKAAQEFVSLGRLDVSTFADTSLQSEPIIQKIDQFSKLIETCRGDFLINMGPNNNKSLNIKQLKDDLDNPSGEASSGHIRPLLKKVKEKVDNFKNNTILNGFAAVEWCIQHGMIQQGYTFLQENIVSYMIDLVLGAARINDHNVRTVVSLLLRGFNKIDKLKSHEQDIANERSKIRGQNVAQAVQWQLSIINNQHKLPRDSNFQQHFIDLSGDFRNDINHAGFSDNACPSNELINQLKNFYQRTKTLLGF